MIETSFEDRQKAYRDVENLRDSVVQSEIARRLDVEPVSMRYTPAATGADAQYIVQHRGTNQRFRLVDDATLAPEGLRLSVRVQLDGHPPIPCD